MKRAALFFGCARGGAFRLGGRARWRWRLPGGRTRRVRQLVDEEILDFHQQGSAGVDLDTQLAIQWDVAFPLGEIKCQLAIDPRADPAALAENPVVVPIPILDDLRQRGGVMRPDEFFVATMFIVQIPPVADARIDLIARHRGLSRFALTSHLDAGVHESLSLDEPDLELQVEVLIPAVRREKEVGGDFLLQRTADDHSVADLPPFFLTGRRFPTGEGLAVEKRDRCRVEQGREGCDENEKSHGD